MSEPKVVRKADFLTVENCNREVDRQRGFVAQLHARVQELEDKYEDSEYRNVHLEKVVDDQQAENARLREALEDYGVHLPRCRQRDGDESEICDCGLADALERRSYV